MNTYLNTLSQYVYEINKEKGFWDDNRTVPHTLMLVVSELGEAVEAHRKGVFADLKEYKNKEADNDYKFDVDTFKEHMKDSFEDEIGDTIIRLLDLIGCLGIHIDYHIKEKLKYNKTRGYKHGKKY